MADFPAAEITLTPENALADTYDVEPLTVIVGEVTPPPDTTAPAVAFVSPAPGSTLAADDAVTFDVTDNLDELQRAIITLVNGTTGDVEVLWDGSSFTPRYAALSVRAAITNGHRYTAQRTGGWPTSTTVTVRVYAVDQDGNLEA